MNLPKQESCLHWPVCKYREEPTCPLECGHFIDAGIEQEIAELREWMKPVEEAYKTYGVSCDPLDPGWQAIKAACEKEEVDPRFICPRCHSENVKLRPMFGSVSVCKDCGYKWNNA